MSKFLILALVAGISCGMAQQSPIEVVKAEWGAGRRWSDVTQRVQAIVNAGQSSFQVDVPALGTDPLVGTPKTLRVRIRARNGQVQSFEYKDLETVNLRTWTGGGRGLADPRGRNRPADRWGAGSTASTLRILSAQYGDGRRQSDVTAALNNAIQGNTLALQATNQNLGGDPAPAVVKQLTVQYQWQGQTHNVTVPENGWLRLPDTTGGFTTGGVATAGLYIVQASYGEGGRQLDVTGRLQSMVQNNQLNVRASNDRMGGDPARGADKKLTIVYDWQGNRYQTVVNEDNNITLPRSGDQLVGTAGGTPAGVPSPDNSGRYFDNADQIWKINGDGVCFYRQTYFKGDAVCLRSGQEAATVGADGNAQFLSVRFFGNTRQVEVWNQPGFRGRTGRFIRDQTDLGRATGVGFGTGAATGAIASARVN